MTIPNPPRSCNSRKVRSSSEAACASSPCVGSSSNKTGGRSARARARATRRCAARSSSPGVASCATVRPTSESNSCAACLASSPVACVCSRSGNSTFSRTLRRDRSAAPSKMTPNRVRMRRTTASDSPRASKRSPSTTIDPVRASSSASRWRMTMDFPECMGPRTTLVLPRQALSEMSKMAGDSSGPVSPVTSRTMSCTLGEARNEVEDDVDERVRGQHAEYRVHDSARRRLADRGDSPLDVEAFIGGDEPDDEREDHALAKPNHQVAHRERRTELLQEEGGAVIEEEGAPDPSAEDDQGHGQDGQRWQSDQQRRELWRHEVFDGIEPHGAQRVDLASGPHCRQLTGDSRRAPCDDEQRSAHRTELARGEPRDGADAHRLRSDLEELRRDLEDRDQANENGGRYDKRERPHGERLHLALDAGTDRNSPRDGEPGEPIQHPERQTPSAEDASGRSKEGASRARARAELFAD